MSRSLSLSQKHIEQAKSAVGRAGYPNQKELAFAVGKTRATISKFLNGKPVDFQNFTEICDELGLDWQEISNLPEKRPIRTETKDGHQQVRDWGDAPEVEFTGHSERKKLLQEWHLDMNCCVIVITGMARIGKTFLAAQVARKVEKEYDFVIWRSVQGYQSPLTLLEDLLKILMGEKFQENMNLETCLIKFVTCLRDHRCLIILNRMEYVMQPGNKLGNFSEGNEAYGRILRQIGEQKHGSQLVVVSREPIKDLEIYTGDERPIRQLNISGLSLEEARQILKERGVHGAVEKQNELIQRYGGHPTFVRMAAENVNHLNKGNIELFLIHQDTPIVINGIKVHLDEIFSRTSEFERILINWIAIYFEPITVEQLAELMPISIEEVKNALLALRRRFILHTLTGDRYQIDPYIREYIIYKLKESIILELQTGRLSLFDQYPIIIAQSEDGIRKQQEKIIAIPLLKSLNKIYGNSKHLENHFIEILKERRFYNRRKPGYAAANLLSFLKLLQILSNPQQNPILENTDFSELTIWQADLRGMRLHEVNFSHADLAHSVFYESFGGILSLSLSKDGKFIAAGDASHNVYVWKLQGKQFTFYRKYSGHTHWVRKVIISPSGNLLASGSEDNTVRIWDLANGQTIAVLRGYDRQIRSLAFDPDEEYLASGGDDGTVVLWSTRTWKRIATYSCISEGGRFREVIFNYNGEYLIAAYQSGIIYVWNIKDDISLQNPNQIRCKDALTRAIAVNPEGNILASGGDEGILRLWQFPTGEFLKELFPEEDSGDLSSRNNWTRDIIFSHDGSLIASSNEDGKIQIWNLKTSRSLSFEAHKGRVWEIAFGLDNKTLLSGSDDRYIKLWDIGDMDKNICISHLQGYTCKLRTVSFSPDGRWLASGGDDQIIKIWDVVSGKCIKQFSGHKGRVWTVAFYQPPHGELFLISGSDDRTVNYWNIDTGERLAILNTHTSWVRALSVNSDHTCVVSGGDDKVVRAVNLKTKEKQEFAPSHTDWIISIAICPNGKYAVSGSDDSTAKVWHMESGELIYTFDKHEGPVRAVAISSNGQWVATGSKDKTVRLFDITDREYTEHPKSPLLAQKGHEDWVRCVAFHPNGHILASGGYDQKVILWNLDSGQPFRWLKGHTGAIISVTFSPDGHTIATGSEDETIKLWDTETGLLIRNIRIPRPYEGLMIKEAVGLNSELKIKLRELGAIEKKLSGVVSQID